MQLSIFIPCLWINTGPKCRNLIKLEFSLITGLTSKQVQRLIKELKSDDIAVTGHAAEI